jgi:predicted ribosomally synthesized peptide with SipW-like signal peptide
MTKFNKVGKSTFVIAILSFLLVAVLAFGGTYAYFSAKTNTFSGNITMGKLYVDLKDGASSVTTLGEITLAHPNQQILNKSYTVDLTKDTNVSTIGAFARVKVTAELTSLTTSGEGSAIVYSGNTQGDAHITPLTIFTVAAGDGWYQHTDGYTYYVANKASGATGAAKAITAAEGKATLPLTIDVNKEVGKGGSTFFMGATGTYTITVEVIQAEYLDSNVTPDNQYTVEKLAAQWNNIVNAGTYPVV